MQIDGRPPSPRSGWAGWLDRFVGPGATPAELALQGTFALTAGVAAPLWAATLVDGWTPVQYAFCAILAVDMAGGVATNATVSGKRWYHRPGQGAGRHMTFAGLHLAHLLVVAWVFLAMNLIWLMVAGGYLLLASAAVVTAPLYLQRPAGLIAAAGGVLLSVMWLSPLVNEPGMAWFLPLFYLKLLAAHLPGEAPSGPAGCSPSP